MDPTLAEFDKNEAERLIRVAFLCTQASPMMRPPMSRVVAMLTGDIEISTALSKPSYLTDWNFKDITASFLNQNDTSTSSTTQREGKSQHKDEPGDMTTSPILPSPVNVSVISDIIGDGR